MIKHANDLTDVDALPVIIKGADVVKIKYHKNGGSLTIEVNGITVFGIHATEIHTEGKPWRKPPVKERL